MTDAHADISQKRRISPIWIVPIVALLLGGWMVVYTIQSQGPEVTILFSTAEGIEEGKTKIKLRNVEIGLVESAGLGDDLESVVVTARLDKDAASLLREDTEFWVVRPRIGKGGISGLSTVLSGGYIKLEPGSSSVKKTSFVGLETPPLTPTGTPGVSLELTADDAGSIGAGDPILYKGFEVGLVETADFDMETRAMRYGLFIEAPYDDLVSTTTRFWNVSGFSFSAGADGIEASTASLETLIVGGLAFGLPTGITPGRPIASGATFQLYESYVAVNERPYRHSVEYVVSFSRSVRGLQPGAPVEYRGLPIGHVVRVMLSEMVGPDRRAQGNPIPVLIRLEPARMELDDSPEGVAQLQERIGTSVAAGMRGSLETGNLLTGSLYVSFDIFPGSGPAEIGRYSGLPEIPTVTSGLGGIEQRLTALLDKVNNLPLEETLSELQGTLASLNNAMASESAQALPGSIDATLSELQRTLASFSSESELQARLLPTITELDQTLASLRQVLDTIAEQPNALIFSRTPREDPVPMAGPQ